MPPAAWAAAAPAASRGRHYRTGPSRTRGRAVMMAVRERRAL